MKTKRFLLSCLFTASLFTAVAEASESGALAYRAQKSLEAGKIAKSYSQLERALLASRKESDLLSESRILISMAQIRTMSLDLDFADSLLSVVRPGALDNGTSLLLEKSKVALANARGLYENGVKVCRSMDSDSLSRAAKPLQGAIYSECAMAYAGGGKSADAEEALKMVGKKLSKDGTLYTFTAARVSHLLKQPEADSLYRAAEKISIQNNKPYTTASILYYRGLLLKKRNPNEARDLFLRSENAFDLMGLPNNKKRSEKEK